MTPTRRADILQAWANYLSVLDETIKTHEQKKVEIADAINDGSAFVIVKEVVYLKEEFITLPSGAIEVDAYWVAARHDLYPSTWDSYASTLSRFPKEERPERFKLLKMGHYQAVDRAKLSQAQRFQLLNAFLDAKERGGYADTDSEKALIPANVIELRKRAELEERTNPSDSTKHEKRGRKTLKTLRNYIGVNMTYDYAQEVALGLNQWLKEPIPFNEIPDNAEITITVDFSYRVLDKK